MSTRTPPRDRVRGDLDFLTGGARRWAAAATAASMRCAGWRRFPGSRRRAGAWGAVTWPGCFHENQTGSAHCAAAEMYEVPVVGEPVLGGILAHG